MQVAVIAEYNPFHAGHEHQLRRLREIFGDDAVLTVILGGIFSQRGEPYLTTPYIRASAALACGADLVVELPFPFSCASANTFARAGVEIAEKLGADVLAFGSVSPLEKLFAARERVDAPAFQAEIARRNQKNPARGALRLTAEVYRETFCEDFPTHENDRLGMAYLRALQGKTLRPLALARAEFASATAIRSGQADLRTSVPTAAFARYEKAQQEGVWGANREALASATLLRLWETPARDAIGERLRGAANAKTMAELLERAATKAYTTAELSRAAVYALLGVTGDALAAPVLCTRLFAANARGCARLREVRDIEVLTKPAAVDKLSPDARAQLEARDLAERAFALCFAGEYNYKKATPEILP